jgi:hypothetical protein
MSYLIIGGTNVAVGQMPGGTNVGGTYVCGTKVAPPLNTPIKYNNVFRLVLGDFWSRYRFRPNIWLCS